jgi:DNA-directed RNA polymerase specialized sigma24 family protein
VHASAQEESRKESIFTPLALSRLLEWLDDGVESHGERYLEMHRRLVSYFDRRNRLAADELADETLRRIAATLDQTGVIRTKPPARYCYVVAKFVLLEDIRRERRQIPFNEVRPAMSARTYGFAGHDDDASSKERRLDVLDRCLEELREEERELIVEYYRDARREGIDHRLRMAERMGITKNALTIRAFRIREALMNCVTCREEH